MSQISVGQSGMTQGLTTAEALALQRQWGKNAFETGSSRNLFTIIGEIIKEPMFILLSIACTLYFILGENSEGLLMAVAMLFVATISLYQEWRSSNAMKALQQYTAGSVWVIRDGEQQMLSIEELVPGDWVHLEEGMLVPADMIIVQANDLSVNESIITGESLPVDKNVSEKEELLFQGTTINSGNCVARVIQTGNRTELGKLGKAVSTYQSPKTLLQLQMRRVVRRLAIFGITGFLFILFINFSKTSDWSASLLLALTLAMSAVPEEIPVALSSFMALGAYKMSRLGIISRQPQVIENLGAVSVICLDKTGTITENSMQVREIFDAGTKEIVSINVEDDARIFSMLKIAALASETRPFDPMEQAIWEAYEDRIQENLQRPLIEYEYALGGRPPMMTHLYRDQDGWLVAGKGAAERVMQVCGLSPEMVQTVSLHVSQMASVGYRVLGKAQARHTGDFPREQDDFDWHFLGLLALYDPPKKDIDKVFDRFYEAHIDIKLLTGDHPQTARHIAAMVGMHGAEKCITGEDLMKLDERGLNLAVDNYHIFARMFPDAKKKLIERLRNRGEIVAMTGDGVNDGPALKAADIGIAMGRKGTEIARRAADLVITDDDLGRMVTAVREGRKIYINLKKAIRYIISIHIPIILVASLPLILGWQYPTIFTPIHVIFLELIMGPTCSIFFEREPAEGNLMRQLPRKRAGGLFTREEWWMSVIQGLIIAAGALFLYYFYMKEGASQDETRTIVFTMLLISNFLLTFSNRSDNKTILKTIRYKNNLAPWLLLVSVLLLLALHFIPSLQVLFLFAPISIGQFMLCLAVGIASVLWIEVYKSGKEELTHP